MPITPEFVALVDRLNQELDRTEARATKGLELARVLLTRPNNAALIQDFAYLNAALLFMKTFKRQIQSVVEAVLPTDIPLERAFDSDMTTTVSTSLQLLIASGSSRTPA